jgi:prepilin-type N-terminal cleavage/methylation domain-containing protein
MHFMRRRQAFTLIELLVVIAIIAILAVVVVLTLNPAQLLAQSRDANRVSDMATLNTALGLYQTDSGGTGFMGTSTVVYISLADNASSTCGSLGLPALPTGDIYNCSPSTSTRLTNTSGWIPINFQNISSGAPFGSLPLDPINTSSTGLYYTYNTSSSQFMVSALPESQKQKQALGAKPSISNYPDVITNGSSLTINPLFNPSGLVGYWPMDEGVGSSTIDQSGNNNGGTWSGTPAGTNSTYYSAGKIGNWAGTFDGTSTYIAVSSSAQIVLGASNFTISVWMKAAVNSNGSYLLAKNDFSSAGNWSLYQLPSTNILALRCDTECASMGNSYMNFPASTWNLITYVRNGSAITGYVNGVQAVYYANYFTSGNFTATGTWTIGSRAGGPYAVYLGSLDDVRIYNRALSAAEIQAMYNAGK